MAIKILQSKLSVPHLLPQAIERRRLLGLVSGSKDANLILLVAPAGYGKTTLAQQVLTPLPPSALAWYHLDPTDAHTDQFLAYLVAALEPVLPKSGVPSVGSDTGQAFADLCFALEQYRGPRFHLVLDNWECVDQNPDLASVPLSLARSGRDRLTLIVASRVPPSFKTRREESRGNAVRLDTAQLSFSMPECQEALRLRFGRDVEDEVLERFWQETSGWCVSVGLLPDTFPQHGFAAAGRGRLSPKQPNAFQAYFTEEVYGTLPVQLATFLCETSLFDVLSAQRCKAVVSEPEIVEECLDRLGRSAIPHVALEERGQYRLHALAREAFRSHLEEIATPDRVADICRATADRYLQEGLIFEAVGLLMELGDFDRALELMDTRWSELFGQHGWSRVRQWLEALPALYHDRAAYIKTYSNVLNAAGDNRGAMQFLQHRLAPDRFADDPESFGSLWANYWWARINTDLGPHYDAIRKDHEGLTAVDRGFSPTMLGIFQNTLGMAAYLELRLHEALAHVRRAAELVEEPYVRLRIIARQNEALYSHLLGSSSRALDLLKQARDDCHRLGLQSQIPKMYMLDANIHLAMGYYRKTLDDIDRCVASMRTSGGYSLQLDAYVGRFRGLALWYLGERAEGLRLLLAAREPAGQFGALTGTEVALLCEYYSLVDDRPLRLLDERDYPATDPPSECGLTALALQAVRALEAATSGAARRHAARIIDLAQRCEMPQWIATGSFLLAMSLHPSRDRGRQKELLERGLGALESIGWKSYPMATAAVTAFVVAKAVRFGLDRSLVDPLLGTGSDIDLTPAFQSELQEAGLAEPERVRIWDAASQLAVRGLAVPLKKCTAKATRNERPALDRYREFLGRCGLPPLRIDMLGGFSVAANGRTIRFNRSSSRLLFLHLLVAHPRNMHEEELIEYLWPEAEPAKGRANLRTGVKDLRKALDPYATPRGASYVVFDDQHYGLELPAESCVDYLTFSDMIHACLPKRAPHPNSNDDRIAALRQALDKYRGPLLPMLPYEAFAVELRERLQTLYQRGSLQLAELLMAENGLEEAAAVTERALAYDPLWTDGVRMLLRIHVMRGDGLRAMRVYRAYESRLQSELGLAPDLNIREYFDDVVYAFLP